MYIDNRILNWDMQLQSLSEIDKKVKARAESLLARAEQHLNIDKSKDSRADCLITLKRVLNQRLKAIERIHEFKKIEIPNQPKGYFELLESFGIVRPLLLKKLLKIRNDIEHEDVDPPNYNQCKEYVDVVWYFIKSTNQLVSMKPNDFIFTKLGGGGIETQYWFSLEIKDNAFENIRITGWFPKEYIRKSTKNKTYIPVDVHDTGTKVERWPHADEQHMDKLPTDTWINGKIILTPDQKRDFVIRVINL